MKTILPIAAAMAMLAACAPARGDGDVADLRLPAGFRAAVFAEVPGARSMTLAADMGALFVGTRGARVYAVELDAARTGAVAVRVLRDGLSVANGVAWRDGYLYVAEQPRLIRLRGDSVDALASATPEILFDGLPDKRHHGWRYARFGPDGALYVTVGAPCNVCAVSGIEGTLTRFRPPAWSPEVFARGVRNSVGLDFQPGTGDVYFTDNGVDWMGNDSPPDELNRAATPGGHFGFPFFGGGDHRAPTMRHLAPPAAALGPEVAFGAHVAALGVLFYRGGSFPAEYRGDAFVAQHGSWNRSPPDGYRVVRVRFDASGRATGHAPFIEGWLKGTAAWGRPVDLLQLPDGSLLVSDDRAGAIYRVTHDPR